MFEELKEIAEVAPRLLELAQCATDALEKIAEELTRLNEEGTTIEIPGLGDEIARIERAIERREART
jgi:hypothetical protein